MPSNPTLLQADWPQAPLLPLPPPGPSCITSLVARGLGLRGKICDKQPAGPTGPLQRSGRLCLQVEVLLLSSKTETQGGWGLRVLLGDLQKGDCQPPTPAQGVCSAAGTECQYPPDVEQSLVAKGRRGGRARGPSGHPLAVLAGPAHTLVPSTTSEGSLGLWVLELPGALVEGLLESPRAAPLACRLDSSVRKQAAGPRQ